MNKTLLSALASLFISAPAVAIEIDQNAPVIDVRTIAEYQQSHVGSAVNIPLSELDKQLNQIKAGKEDTVYVYCRSGRRSGMAKQLLEQAGYQNVINLGGLNDAKKAYSSSK